MSFPATPDNRLFVLARQGQRQPSALVAIALTSVTLVVAVIGGQMASRVAIGLMLPKAEYAATPLADGVRDLLTFTLGFVPIYLCVWAWVALWSKRSFRTLGFERQHPLARVVGGGTVAFSMMSAVAIGLALLPDTAFGITRSASKEGCAIPCVRIEDYPRFEWRGMHLDVSRHFFDVPFLKRYLDHLAMHKINVFHWHLTDDDGWRVEIKKYPKFTRGGAWRGPNEARHALAARSCRA